MDQFFYEKFKVIRKSLMYIYQLPILLFTNLISKNVKIIPRIDTINAIIIKGIFVSMSGEFNPLGSKLTNRAMYVTPEENDQPNKSNKF